MMKKTSILLTLCVIACSFTSPRPVRPHQKSELRTIVIDPGHGGFDPGCHGLFAKEKDVALAISLKLGKAIEQAFPDIKVIYTRTTDIMPGNARNIHDGCVYRADMANRAHGDLFLSIHCNSNGKSAGIYHAKKLIGHKMVGKGRKRRRVPIYETYSIKNRTVGTTSFVWKATWGEYKSTMINGAGGGEDMGDSTAIIDVSSPEARMRAQLYEKKYFANSALFATYVQDEFLKSGRVSEGVQQREVGIWVLEATGMPSILVETGYLTNKEEEQYLSSKGGQNEVVHNILDALRRYKSSLDGDGGTNTTRVNPRSPVRTAR